MAKGYLFISNSTKPTEDVLESTAPIGPNSFSEAAIWAANEMGWELHMGVNRNHPKKIKCIGYDIKFYNQHSYRNIFALRDNWVAYRNLCKYLKENPQIEIIHCNTPIGGVVGRLAGKRFGKKVIYTAHGFHFFKGAPFFNRTVLKWIEKYLAHWTDILITINKEDYEAAKKFKLKKNGRVLFIPGVGINEAMYKNTKARETVLNSLQIPNESFICISMGDIIKRKNYKTAIEAIHKLNRKDVHYLICGRGDQYEYIKDLIKRYDLEENIHLLGFRNDIKDLLAASDCFVFTSLQEGLPRSTMEAMAAGLPCVLSDIRGNNDLIENDKGGFLVSPEDSVGFALAIKKMMDNADIRKKMSEWNLNRIKDFSIDKVKVMMLNAFKTV